MKLLKDYFSQSDILSTDINIKKNIIKYVEDNNLTLFSYVHDKKKILISNQHNNYYEKITNYKQFLNNEFSIYSRLSYSNCNPGTPTHSIRVSIGGVNHNTPFYLTLFRNLNEQEKKIFVKTIFHDFLGNNNFFNHLNKNLQTDEYWFHLRNFLPFGATTKSISDARDIFSSLQDRSIDTKDKVYSLLYTIQHYKQICKRPDIKTGLIKILSNKLNDEFIPEIESFLKIKIDKNPQPIDLFETPNSVVTLLINKENIFNIISFEKIPQARVDNYNKYLQQINNFLSSEDIKEKLNIDFIDYIDFSSKKHPARVYIHSNNEGFVYDIKEIYSHLMISCSNHLIDEFMEQNFLHEVLDKSLNFYLLDKKISNNKSELNTPIKPKIKKI